MPCTFRLMIDARCDNDDCWIHDESKTSLVAGARELEQQGWALAGQIESALLAMPNLSEEERERLEERFGMKPDGWTLCPECVAEWVMDALASIRGGYKH